MANKNDNADPDFIVHYYAECERFSDEDGETQFPEDTNCAVCVIELVKMLMDKIDTDLLSSRLRGQR